MAIFIRVNHEGGGGALNGADGDGQTGGTAGALKTAALSLAPLAVVVLVVVAVAAFPTASATATIRVFVFISVAVAAVFLPPALPPILFVPVAGGASGVTALAVVPVAGAAAAVAPTTGTRHAPAAAAAAIPVGSLAGVRGLRRWWRPEGSSSRSRFFFIRGGFRRVVPGVRFAAVAAAVAVWLAIWVAARFLCKAVPQLGHGLRKVHLDSPVVDEDSVHLAVRFLARFQLLELNERVVQAVPRHIVSNDVALHDLAEPAEDQLEIFVTRHRVQFGDEQRIFGSPGLGVWQVPKHLQHRGPAPRLLHLQLLLDLLHR
eukprot:CAMPEP_0171636356 /NCGR_PEP_ID=MMETSP0990-20121206/27353_1 /TAXON_ID=483369 /ORGANISM="non described non described, Strain CCMP2098" /LENGTH=316 /DNA_ID=CAMNT_0012208455 /DNA_START=252 /DNA_END=1200 /DNA_ORIENTATION=-